VLASCFSRTAIRAACAATTTALALERVASLACPTLPLSPSHFVFVFAEANRAPFDLAEAEQELVGGFHTEYSSMKFANFFLAEYIHVIMGSALITTLFFGGYLLPFESAIIAMGVDETVLMFLQIGSFMFKTFFFVFVFIWVRWTLPRFKYTQLMNIGWKWFLPLSILNIMVLAGILLLLNL
jgi:NADH-quinone oxidoreductase subunit H